DKDRVWTNRGIGLNRRVIAFLSGRPVQIQESRVFNPESQFQINKFLNRISGNYAIVYSEKFALPEWHRPMSDSTNYSSDPWWKRIAEKMLLGASEHDPLAAHESWWRLYVKDPKNGQFSQVVPPRNRDYVHNIPPSAL